MLRIASWNVRTGLAPDGRHVWPLRRRAVASAIEALGADVLGLQEVHRFQLRWLQRRLPELDAAGVGRADGRSLGEHCPVLWRRDRFELVASTTRWLSDEPDRAGSRLRGARFARIATCAHLRALGGGGRLDVWSTHLDHARDDVRARQAEVLASLLDAAVPTVVALDANAGPDAELFATLGRAGLHHVLPADAGTSFPGFGGRGTGPRLDHVLVSDDLRGGRGWVERSATGASDHWPVVAEVHGEW